MKTFLCVIIFSVSMNACAMGSKIPDFDVRKERGDKNKIWRACQDTEDALPVGKLCNHVCVKIKHDGSCKEWKVNIKNFSDKDTFLFFRNAGFVFIDEDSL